VPEMLFLLWRLPPSPWPVVNPPAPDVKQCPPRIPINYSLIRSNDRPLTGWCRDDIKTVKNPSLQGEKAASMVNSSLRPPTHSKSHCP